MLYKILKPIALVLMKLVFFIRRTGHENIPETGGCILASNHMSLVDPAFILVMSKRPVSFMAKAELFSGKFAAWFLRSFDAFPVRRGKGDVAAVKTALEVLEQEKVMGIFPQGRRVSPQMKKVRNKTGVALIALRSGCPVVPVYIGTKNQRLRPFRRVTVVFGKPLQTADLAFGDTSAENLQAVTEKIMSEVAALADKP